MKYQTRSLRSIVKQGLLRWIAQLYLNVRTALLRQSNQRKSAKEVFTRIYEENKWGGIKGQYCSGSGSTGGHASLYGEMVRLFIKDKTIHSVLDLGCGDFAVGAKIQMEGVRYFGIDIVDGLIVRNQREFGSAEVSFHCLDIVLDELPDADLCLIRQVLQHLSNAQIMEILHKIKKYKYVLVTEHYPSPFVKAIPNKDKPHGADIRIYDDSAVYLDLPPFNLKIAAVILDTDAGNSLAKDGVLRTFLIENRN
jgi:SAM-dependent methyltransferase